MAVSARAEREITLFVLIPSRDDRDSDREIIVPFGRGDLATARMTTGGIESRALIVRAVTSRIAIESQALDNSNVRKFEFYPTERFREAVFGSRNRDFDYRENRAGRKETFFAGTVGKYQRGGEENLWEPLDVPGILAPVTCLKIDVATRLDLFR